MKLKRATGYHQKTMALELKELKEEAEVEEGIFEAYASVFGNVDSYGDMVDPNAFDDTLKEWLAKGLPIPLYYGHDMMDPHNNVGFVEGSVDDHGLKVRGHLDLTHGNGAVVYHLLKTGRLAQLSFGYSVLDAEAIGTGPEAYLLLKKLELHEVSVVPVGANPLTEILGVKAGRVLSKKNADLLKEAQQLIQEVLNVLGEEEEPEGDNPSDSDEDGQNWSSEDAKFLMDILKKGKHS